MPAEQEQLALVLGPEDDGKLISADEFALAEFAEGWKYEREEGRLVVMAPDGQAHNDATRPWRKRLAAYWNAHPELVEDVLPSAWVRDEFGNDSIGDLGIFLVSNIPAPPVPYRVPDLMFEIVSPGRESRDRDYVKKRERYYKIGIREYVIVDRFTRTVLVLTHRPEGYAERLLTEEDVYTSPLLPGFELALRELF